MPSAHIGPFIEQLGSPLTVGKVSPSDGRNVLGFLCEAAAVSEAEDITAYGSWPAYLAR